MYPWIHACIFCLSINLMYYGLQSSLLSNINDFISLLLPILPDGSKTPKLSLNGRARHVTVMEGDKVQFRCESDGRPAPNISIYNNDNNSVIVRGSSLVVYTVIARCQDIATYSCAAKNEFSRHVTSSYNIKLGVGCECTC